MNAICGPTLMLTKPMPVHLQNLNKAQAAKRILRFAVAVACCFLFSTTARAEVDYATEIKPLSG